MPIIWNSPLPATVLGCCHVWMCLGGPPWVDSKITLYEMLRNLLNILKISDDFLAIFS
jgi:hypothetical protein